MNIRDNGKTGNRHSFRLATMLVLLLTSLVVTGEAQQVHELSYTGSWSDTNLGGTLIAPLYQFGGVLAFTTTPNNQQHIYYVGNDMHMHQHYQAMIGSFLIWVDEDLTHETYAPLVGPMSVVAGFAIQNQQYVYYNTADAHIHQLFYNNVGWSDSDITAQGGGVPLFINAGDDLVAFTTTPNNQIHVYYTSQHEEIHQLFFNGTKWSDENLTAETKGTPALNLYETGFSVGNYQYIFYMDGVSGQFHIHELYYNNVSWNDVDLTLRAGLPIDSWNATALAIPGTQVIELYYVSYYDVIQLTSSDNYNWTKADLTYITGGPPASLDIGMKAFITPGNLVHVYYLTNTDSGQSPHVNQFFFNGRNWSNEDLTAETNGPVAAWGQISGFAIGNWQYVAYGAAH